MMTHMTITRSRARVTWENQRPWTIRRAPAGSSEVLEKAYRKASTAPAANTGATPEDPATPATRAA